MALHDSTILLGLSLGIPFLIALILWLYIHKASRSLNVPEKRKNFVSLAFGIALFGWFFFALILSLLDLFHVKPEFISPLVPIGFIAPLIIGFHFLKNSVLFRNVVDALPQHLLIGIQVSRLLGYAFLTLMAAGFLPALFAIPSGFGDILVGITAPFVAFFYWKKFSFAKNLAVLWNIVGIIDLVVAISLGIILAFPQPFQLIPVTPTTEIMTVFPMAMVPVFAVPLGLLLHVVSLRRLLKEKQTA